MTVARVAQVAQVAPAAAQALVVQPRLARPAVE